MGLLDRFKVVHRDSNGKVVQIHEVYQNDIHRKLVAELENFPNDSFTVTRLK